MKSALYVRRYNKVRRAIRRTYRQLRRKGGWRAVAAQFGIHFTMANRIAVEGYMPSDQKICEILGLPVTVEVEINPKTGRVIIPPELRRKRKEVVQVDEVKVEDFDDISEKEIVIKGMPILFKVGNEISYTAVRHTRNTVTYSCREGIILGFFGVNVAVMRNGRLILVDETGIRPIGEAGFLSECFGLGKKGSR